MATKNLQTVEFTINPNEIEVRDYNMLLVISGATKAAVYVDRRKQNNKRKCRMWKHNQEE